MMFPKPFKIRSKAVTDSAWNQTCTLRLPGICNRDASTTVLCHLPGHAKGTSTKESDIHAAYGCSACHDAIDRGTSTLPGAVVLDAMLRALSETQARMYEMGLITVKGVK